MPFPTLVPADVSHAPTSASPARRSVPDALQDGRLALVLLAGVPLVLLPGGLDRFTLPKLAVAACAVLASVPALRRGVLPRSVVVLLCLGAAWMLDAALASSAPIAQLLGRWPRYEGLVALPVYVGAVWAGARLLGPGVTARAVRSWVRALTAVAVLLAIVCVVEATGLRPLGGDVSRPGASLGNATDQGVSGMLLVALLLPFAVSGISRGARPSLSREALPPVLGVACALAVVVTSGSRAALLGTVVVCIVLPAVSWRGAPRTAGPPRCQRAASALATLAVAGLALLGAFLLPASRDRLTGQDPLAAATVTGRADLWASVVAMVAERPLLGAGPSGLVDAYPAFRSAHASGSAAPSSVLDSPHSWPLQAAAAGGLPLLVCALALCATVVVVGLRRVRQVNAQMVAGASTDQDARRLLVLGASAALAGTAAALTTHFTTVSTVVLAGVAAGALLAVPGQDPGVPDGDRHGARWIRRGATTLGAVLCLGLLLGAAAEVPLARAVTAASTGDVAASDSWFERAQALRPWDGDVPLIAAQTFAAGAEAGHAPSARATVEWAAPPLIDRGAPLARARAPRAGRRHGCRSAAGRGARARRGSPGTAAAGHRRRAGR